MFLMFAFVNMKFEENPQEYYEPISFRPMILPDNEANYYFDSGYLIHQYEWEGWKQAGVLSVKQGIEIAKALVKKHPQISEQAKEKIANVKIGVRLGYCNSAIGLCGGINDHSSISVQISRYFFDRFCHVDTAESLNPLVFGLLREFSHVVYDDLSFVFAGKTEIERLKAFEECLDFSFQNKRAMYFALELLKNKGAAEKFFEEEETLLFVEKNKIEHKEPFKQSVFICSSHYMETGRLAYLNFPCQCMGKEDLFNESLSRFKSRIKLAVDYGLFETLDIESGNIFSLN